MAHVILVDILAIFKSKLCLNCEVACVNITTDNDKLCTEEHKSYSLDTKCNNNGSITDQIILNITGQSTSKYTRLQTAWGIEGSDEKQQQQYNYLTAGA